MATDIWVSISSGNGLLPDGTKPMLTYHQIFSLAFVWEEFHKSLIRSMCREITLLKWLPHIPEAT